MKQALTQRMMVDRINSQLLCVNQRVDQIRRQQMSSRKKEDASDAKSGTQSNEIDDLDEQNNDEVKVNQINNPERQIKPGAGGPSASEAQSNRLLGEESEERKFEPESANVSDKAKEESSIFLIAEK